MSLRVLAVSSPHWISRVNKLSSLSFNSKVPFSLQNALRDAAHKAKNGFSKAWSNSNFKNFKERNEAVLLMEFWENDRLKFEKLFNKINPNLLLIGAMTLSFRGAIELAKYAKSKKGDNIFIVLGGKHVSETLFKSRKGLILNHIGSPVKLMYEGLIPKIFDLVVSGDGEKVITKIGNIVGHLVEKQVSLKKFYEKIYLDVLKRAQGNWIVSYIEDNKVMYCQNEPNNNIDYASLAYSLKLFNINEGFKIFGTDLTAHAYSDNSRGCGYDCFFCSEKSSINGKLRIKDNTSVNRLFQQFYELKKIKRYKNKTISVFVEDSIALTGKPKFLNDFATRCLNHDINIKFGLQFTLDTFLSLEKDVLRKLIDIGLDYVAFGIETINDDIAKSFSKNTNKNTGWIEKTELVVKLCKDLSLKCGMFLIWGFGETQDDRRIQLLQILGWVNDYKIPIDIGLNIATQHPLQIVKDNRLDKYGYKKYDYLKWGTPKDDPYLPYFIEFFGEASTEYAIHKDKLPTISDLEELKEIYEKIKEKTYSMV